MTDFAELSDAEWEQHLDRLGPPTDSFRVRGIAVQLFAGGLLIVGSLAVLVLIIANAANIKGWAAAGKALVLLVMAPFFGALAIWHALRARGLHVLVYPTGVLRIDRQEVLACKWGELKFLTFTPKAGAELQVRRGPDRRSIESAWVPVPRPWVMTWKAHLVLHRLDGTVMEFTGQLRRYGDFARLVQQESFARLYPPAVRAVEAGAEVAFGDLKVGAAGLRAPSGLLPWNEVKKVAIVMNMLQISSTRRKWVPWHTQAGLDAFPDLHVFLALVAHHQPAVEVEEEEEEDGEE